MSVLSGIPMQAQKPVLTRHVSSEIATGKTQRLATVPEDQTLKLSLMLPLHNESQLDALLSQLYDQHSPLYHHWLSVAEFTDKFGPTQGDFNSVVEFAKANSMKVTVTPGNRRLVGVESSVANINRAFHVTMGTYQHPYENRTFYSPDREPTVDLSVPLLHIAGLTNIATAYSMLRQANTLESSRTETSIGSGPGGQYYGSDMRAAYYGGTALTGAGQSIGIYGADYNISDVEAYFSNVGQSFNPSTVQNYSADGTVNSCGSGCDDGEPVIDIVESLSMAPGVNSIIVYFGASQEEVFNEMASTNTAKQLSTSILYKYTPAPGTSFDSIFKEFAAQGQNLFAASGDSGAYTSSNTPYFPTDDPYITAVGGTDLTTTGAGGAWQSETAWIGSGGGLDTYQNYAIPSYQQLSGVIDSANQGSTTIRNIPDVAIEADTDNWYCVNGNPCTGGVGGTSLAAPRWAGFLALVNEQAANNGNASIGFLNPTIYSFGVESSYGSTFHDIVSGNNGDGSGASYNAVTGYDLVTGWGSPNGQGLIDALAGGTSYNVYGIYTDGTSFSTGGLDNDGYAYSSNQLGSSLTWNGISFTFGSANAPDAYSSETIPLPSGQYSTLNLLATGVNGNQASQTFIVTYTDGSTSTFTQSLSDWFTPQSYSGESIALSTPYRDTASGGSQNATFNLYGYSFAINSSKILQSLTLPGNRDVVVLGVVPNLNGAHTLTPQNATDSRMDDYSSSTAAGNMIDVYTANGTGAQTWVFSNVSVVPSGDYNIAVSYGAYCANAAGSTNGSLVDLEPCSGASSQSWKPVLAGEYYELQPANGSGLCLDAPGSANYTQLQVTSCTGSASQLWAID